MFLAPGPTVSLTDQGAGCQANVSGMTILHDLRTFGLETCCLA
jgi:hypothetical protein